MPGALTPPSQDGVTWRDVQQIYGLLTGQDKWGVPVSLTSVDDDANYALTITNQGSGGHLAIPGLLVVTSTAVNVSTLNVSTLSTTNLTATGTSTLNVANVTTLTVSGVTTLNGNATVGNAPSDVLTVEATSTFDAPVSLNDDLTISGSSILATVDVSAGIINLGNQAGPGLYIDAPNLRTLIGSATPLGGAADDKLSVIGGALHVAASNSTNAINVRYGALGSAWALGATALIDPDLVFEDGAGTEVFRLGDASAATYQAEVTGDFHVTDDATVEGDLIADRIAVNETGFAGSESLRVNGTSRLQGAVVVTSGGASITGGLLLASSGDIDGNGGTAGQLRIGAVVVNAASLVGTEKLRVAGTAVIDSTLTVNGEAIAKAPVVGQCSGALTLTTSHADIAGCSGILSPGNWLVIGNFDFVCTGTDTGVTFLGTCVASGGTATVTTAGQPRFVPAASGDVVNVTGAWHVSVTATTTAKLQARKSGGTGTSTTGTQSTFTAVFVGKP